MATRSYIASLAIRRLKSQDGSLDEAAPKICFKRDGQRFEEEYTLKLPVETSYEFQLNVRPPMPVRSVTLRTPESPDTGVKIVDNSAPGEGACYTFQWTVSELQPDKKGKRSMDNMTLELPLQIKFYKPEDAEHLAWGTPLTHINYECERKPGVNSATILKTCFL